MSSFIRMRAHIRIRVSMSARTMCYIKLGVIFMAKYIVKRILLMLLTMFIIMTVCFVLVRCLPYSFAHTPGSDDYYIELARREALGYNKPIFIQYLIFLKQVFTKFDWGISFKIKFATPVTELVFEKLPPTIIVNVYTMLFSVPIGIFFGVYSALKKNKWQDHVIGIFTMAFISVPSYVFAFLIQYLFAYKLGWFDLQMSYGTDYLSLSMLKSLVLPILAMSFGTIAGFTRYIRDELSEVLTSEFMLLARTKGLTRRQATVRHAFRNALVPILPMFIGEFIGILGGSMIIENIFGIPGVGKIYLQAIQARDYDVFLFVSMFYVVIGLVAGIVVDISYGFVDPRIRIGGKK